VRGLRPPRRKKIGSTWRLLYPGRQALLVLVYLRKDETFAEISTGFAVSATTAWRYVEGTVLLLSARSPKLAQALRKATKDGLTHVILDGTLIHTDRVKADRPYFSGKHRVHGMNVQVISSPDGTILWTSGALPGKTHDLTAARIWGMGKNKPEPQKRANRSHARLRGPGERANAQLKSWRILRKLRCSPTKAGHLVKAIAVLQNHRVAQATHG
jgi:hypothetical protein